MNKEEIRKEITKIVAEHLNIPVDMISENSKLMEDFGASSFDIMVLLPEIEDAFGIEFSVRDLRDIITIDDLVDDIMRNRDI